MVDTTNLTPGATFSLYFTVLLPFTKSLLQNQREYNLPLQLIVYHRNCRLCTIFCIVHTIRPLYEYVDNNGNFSSSMFYIIGKNIHSTSTNCFLYFPLPHTLVYMLNVFLYFICCHFCVQVCVCLCESTYIYVRKAVTLSGKRVSGGGLPEIKAWRRH